jgi:hypothetical protein
MGTSSTLGEVPFSFVRIGGNGTLNQDLTVLNLRYSEVRLTHKKQKGTISVKPFFETPPWQQANELGVVTLCLCAGERQTVSCTFGKELRLDS